MPEALLQLSGTRFFSFVLFISIFLLGVDVCTLNIEAITANHLRWLLQLELGRQHKDQQEMGDWHCDYCSLVGRYSILFELWNHLAWHHGLLLVHFHRLVSMHSWMFLCWLDLRTWRNKERSRRQKRILLDDWILVRNAGKLVHSYCKEVKSTGLRF